MAVVDTVAVIGALVEFSSLGGLAPANAVGAPEIGGGGARGNVEIDWGCVNWGACPEGPSMLSKNPNSSLKPYCCVSSRSQSLSHLSRSVISVMIRLRRDDGIAGP